MSTIVERELKERVFSEYWSQYGRLVYHVVRRTAGRVDEDLEQVGRVALWEAICTYDPTLNIRFTSYLWDVVYYHVKQWLWYSRSQPDQIPIDTVMSRVEYGDGEFAVPIGLVYDEGGYDRVVQQVDRVRLVRTLSGILTERQMYCLCRYFGLTDEGASTMEEIASDLGITRAAVCDSIQNAIKRIRKNIDKVGFLFS